MTGVQEVVISTPAEFKKEKRKANVWRKQMFISNKRDKIRDLESTIKVKKHELKEVRARRFSPNKQTYFEYVKNNIEFAKGRGWAITIPLAGKRELKRLKRLG